MSSKAVEFPAIWIAGAACSGCSVLLLNSISPSIQNVLVDPVLPGKHVSLIFHATLMAGQGEPVVKILRETISQKPNEYILMVEGSVPTAEDGLYCTIGKLDGEEVVMKDMTAELARDALAVLAVGTCSSYGGIPSGAPNPTGALSVADFFKDEGVVELTKAYCDLDKRIAELVPDHIELKRQHTLAKGDNWCDFYYYKK